MQSTKTVCLWWARWLAKHWETGMNRIGACGLVERQSQTQGPYREIITIIMRICWVLAMCQVHSFQHLCVFMSSQWPLCYYHSLFIHDETEVKRGYETCWGSLKQPEFELGVSDSKTFILNRCGQLSLRMLMQVNDWLIWGRAIRAWGGAGYHLSCFLMSPLIWEEVLTASISLTLSLRAPNIVTLFIHHWIEVLNTSDGKKECTVMDRKIRKHAWSFLTTVSSTTLKSSDWRGTVGIKIWHGWLLKVTMTVMDIQGHVALERSGSSQVSHPLYTSAILDTIRWIHSHVTEQVGAGICEWISTLQALLLHHQKLSSFHYSLVSAWRRG